MLIALGNVNTSSLFEGLKHMAENKSQVTSQMVNNLTDQKLKEKFLKLKPHHQDGWGISHLEKNNFVINKSLNTIFK